MRVKKNTEILTDATFRFFILFKDALTVQMYLFENLLSSVWQLVERKCGLQKEGGYRVFLVTLQ